ncbi:EamA family transporter [Solirubrobacter sp. CPCC 204708]|uniref:EamA family transporter n=1 Tax=Solirubrobacter deserti TaxID=2282478 RepID=A0ABT4RL49_9ACTN|nr:EamA family transporter [Solirubrobacter deserti]MBE2318997.1 EamA family transporter [Solirubrobacter deserti]MDA0139278.1 EamA family transporter [Solirubrobacter deserti]
MPNPRLGYLLTVLSATCSALNGSLSRYLLDEGMSPARLSEFRSAVSALLLVAALAAFSPGRLRIARRDVPQLAWLGIAGIALVHATYYAAIARMDIGVALVIQYLAPAMLLIWAAVVHRVHAPRSLWAAVALSVAGCALVVDAPSGAGNLDGVGVVFALLAAVTLAIYLTASQKAGERYDAFTTLTYGFGFATVFWLVVAPVWSFPWELLGSLENLAVALGVATIGTLIPFLLLVTALRHLPAAKVAVVATLEPVLASVFAWFLLDQSLSAVQIAGGVVVLAAVTWVRRTPWTSSSPADTGRSPAGSSESSPATVTPPAG